MKADLHLHTCASDGTWRPEELIQNIISAGIGLFAVTDHDSVESIPAVSSLAEKNRLNYIRGVEISTTENGRIFHILGYNIDPENSALNEVLMLNRNSLETRNKKSIEILRERGYPVSPDEYLLYENNPERGGWKALNYAIDKGVCRTYREFFQLFGNREIGMSIDGCVTPGVAISAIKEAGGISVLAHPGSGIYGDNPAESIKLAFDKGIEGVECFHPENNAETTEYSVGFCRRKGLYITGGSDCHGTFVKERWLGKPDVRVAQLSLWDI
ncbi:MAG: PHP domain-containing protein [Deltaproteobacteria bacterium]|jgi:predicted metal-dependent phosphoesterase TrpH|nr:PHP domain-containing protein [Deltaproteobacteria bacterium]